MLSYVVHSKYEMIYIILSLSLYSFLLSYPCWILSLSMYAVAEV
jgi:hypothetical protein